jgi:hypothetical protein
MKTLVAVALSASTPYIFKILMNFLIVSILWLHKSLESLSSRRPLTRPAESECLLNQGPHRNYGTTPSHRDPQDSDTQSDSRLLEDSNVQTSTEAPEEYNAQSNDAATRDRLIRQEGTAQLEYEESFLDVSGRSNGIRNTVVNVVKHLRKERPEHLDLSWFQKGAVLLIIGFIGILVAGAIAWIIVGVFSGDISKDRTARLRSDQCGIQLDFALAPRC